MEEKTQEIGRRIKALREEKGWSQVQLVRLTGLSAVGISNYEAGKRRAPLEKLELIASALSVPLEALLKDPA